MHTTAPWTINPYKADYQVVSTDAPGADRRQSVLESAGLNRFKAVSVGTSGGQVAIIPLDESNMANARLIESAPELLEALQLFIEAEAGHGWSDLRADCIERIAYEKAKAAVAKAQVS